MICTLSPINLYNPSEYATLQHQRHICGWDYSDESILAWREKQDADLKTFFWIILPGKSGDEPIRAGHISLDAYASPPDPGLAQADHSILTIQSFFILPEYRAGGVGRRAMQLVEEMAVNDPRCQTVTVNALSKDYIENEEKRAFLESMNAVPEFPAVLWYERLGYVRWKTEPRYPYQLPQGGDGMYEADFLRKTLR